MKNLITLLATIVSSIVVAQTNNITTNDNSILLPDSAQIVTKHCRSTCIIYMVDAGCKVISQIIQKETPFFDPEITSGKTFTKEEYKHLAVKDIPSVVATMPGVFVNGSGDISIRGSRFYSTQIIVDGQKIQNIYGISARGFREK